MQQKSNHWSENYSLQIFTEFYSYIVLKISSLQKLKTMSEIQRIVELGSLRLT